MKKSSDNRTNAKRKPMKAAILALATALLLGTTGCSFVKPPQITATKESTKPDSLVVENKSKAESLIEQKEPISTPGISLDEEKSTAEVEYDVNTYKAYEKEWEPSSDVALDTFDILNTTSKGNQDVGFVSMPSSWTEREYTGDSETGVMCQAADGNAIVTIARTDAYAYASAEEAADGMNAVMQYMGVTNIQMSRNNLNGISAYKITGSMTYNTGVKTELAVWVYFTNDYRAHYITLETISAYYNDAVTLIEDSAVSGLAAPLTYYSDVQEQNEYTAPSKASDVTVNTVNTESTQTIGAKQYGTMSVPADWICNQNDDCLSYQSTDGASGIIMYSLNGVLVSDELAEDWAREILSSIGTLDSIETVNVNERTIGKSVGTFTDEYGITGNVCVYSFRSGIDSVICVAIGSTVSSEFDKTVSCFETTYMYSE